MIRWLKARLYLALGLGRWNPVGKNGTFVAKRYDAATDTWQYRDLTPDELHTAHLDWAIK